MESDGRKRPNKFIEVLLLPIKGLNIFTGFILKKALKTDFGNVTEDDILSMVDAGNESGLFEESSAMMINKVFEFDDLKAEDVMTHRVNIVGVDVKTDIDDIVYLALEKGFSRIPVFKDTIDQIIGIVIVKDLLSLIGNDNYKDNRIEDFLREAVYLPESCSCSDTFKYLTNMKSGIAVIVDEYGGTAGIVTLEDLIEAIMGNIQDEYDDENAEIRRIGNGKYELHGEADPDEVLELFGYSLEEDHEYDTIAGFVTDLLGYIPEDLDNLPHVSYKDIRFIVKEMQDNCISKLVVVTTEEL